MQGIGQVSSTVTPSLMLTKPLNSSQLESINLEYGLDLAYDNATHYRAAQVIWTQKEEIKVLARAADPGADSPAAIPTPEGSASSYPATNDGTAD